MSIDKRRPEEGLDRKYQRGDNPATETPGPDSPSLYGVASGTFAGVGPKNYKRSDQNIYEDVCEALSNAPDIDARGIEVGVEAGEVTLTGTVNSRYSKRLTEGIIENLQGVRDVRNRLEIVNEGNED